MSDRERRVANSRLQYGKDGILFMPFKCFHCEDMKTDFGMTTGDGVPVCEECIQLCVAAISGVKT